MSNPFIRAEDANKKGFDFSPWGGLEGFLEASKTGNSSNVAALKRLVPDLAHAVDMTATAIANLPFDLVPYEKKQEPKKAEDEPKETQEEEAFDSSKDWQNKLGGIPNPKRIIYQLASSLCGGAAYLLPFRTNRAIGDLRYAPPHTITPQINQDGLQYFDRTSDQGKAEHLTPDKVIYFWLPDSDVEIGPAQNHPLGNASLDAQLVYSMKSTMNTYGKRGFVPITLLGAKGMPGNDERLKAEGFFDRLLRGGFNVLAKIINAENLELIRVGAGMEELKQSYLEIRRDAKESIADSFGIPPSMFMSDKAYASEMDVLMRQWYTDSHFVSICLTLEEGLTEQLFKPFGYKWRFAMETLDIFQEDESERAASLNQLVSAISTDPSIAKWSMSVLGYDLTTEQKKALDELLAKKEEEKKQEQEQAAKEMEQNAQLQREEMQSRERMSASKPAAKHYGPGSHENGSPQEAHAGDGQSHEMTKQEYHRYIGSNPRLVDFAERMSDTSRGRRPRTRPGEVRELIEAGLAKEMIDSFGRTYVLTEAGQNLALGHRRDVVRAIREGKPTYPTVLLDYPDLANLLKENGEKPKSLTPDEMKDITLWYTKACNWFAKGKGTAADWENKYLPETIAAPIRIRLVEAKTLDDIKAAFDIGETTITEAPKYSGDLERLAISIEKAVEAIKE